MGLRATCSVVHQVHRPPPSGRAGWRRNGHVWDGSGSISSRAFRGHVWSLGARPAIPPKATEAPVACPPWIYANRNRVERLWGRPALLKACAASARSLRLWVRTRSTGSRPRAASPRAVRAAPRRRLCWLKPLSACRRWLWSGRGKRLRIARRYGVFGQRRPVLRRLRRITVRRTPSASRHGRWLCPASWPARVGQGGIHGGQPRRLPHRRGEVGRVLARPDAGHGAGDRARVGAHGGGGLRPGALPMALPVRPAGAEGGAHVPRLDARSRRASNRPPRPPPRGRSGPACARGGPPRPGGA